MTVAIQWRTSARDAFLKKIDDIAVNYFSIITMSNVIIGPILHV